MNTTLLTPIAPNLAADASNALPGIAEIGIKAMVDSIENDSKTGVLYKRRGGFHTASRAGESPAKDSGHLTESFAIDSQTQTQIVVANNAPYAARLEDKLERPITQAANTEAVLDEMENALLDHLLRAF